MSKRAAFLDRDGTLNERPPEHEYVTRVEDFRLLPGAVEGMVRLAGCGYELVVVSNQRGLARGLVTEEVLRGIEEVLRVALEPNDVAIAGFRYCPHDLADDCDCRKPKPGLLLDAAAQRDLDLEASWMIGDADTDIAAGIAAGCRTAYIGEAPGVESTIRAPSLDQAATLICSAS